MAPTSFNSFSVWNCSESPFLKVCKLTDFMAVKVRIFTDLEAVLFEYYRVKSSNGLNMQGLIHVMIKSKLLIRAFKVGGFTGLVAVLESPCGHFVLCFFCFWFFDWSSHWGIFKSYGDVTIAGEGLQILTHVRHSWPLSSEGSLACNTDRDKGHPFIMVIS